MVIELLYMFHHLMAFFLLSRAKYFYVFLAFLSIACIYILKNDSYDILTYTEAMNYPSIFELGFAGLSFLLKSLFIDNRLTLFMIQIILVILFLSFIFQLKQKESLKQKLIYILIIVASVAFTLGINNAIRQSFASLFLIWSFYFIHHKKYFSSFLLFLFAISFHNSSIIFYIFLIEVNILSSMLYFRKIFSFSLTIITQIVLTIFGIGLLFLLLRFGFYSGYADRVLGAEGTLRALLYVKVMLLFVVFIISEYMFGYYTRIGDYFEKLRFIRSSLIILLILLSLNVSFNELGSRVMYFYFIVELALMLQAYEQGRRKSVVFIIISYAFAINAINILGGS